MSFEENGFELIDNFISAEQLKNICDDIELFSLVENSGGVRNAEKKFESIKNLAFSKHLNDTASNYLKNTPNFVRAILFDKTPKNNWLVSWHQDKTVTVSNKFKKEGWEPWSIKDGIIHVQPPIEVLEQMVSFRIHLDDSKLDNGCLKIIPKSHKYGIVDTNKISEIIKKEKVINFEAEQRSALVMKPHLLHSSSKSINPNMRRVLHLEYCSYDLPVGIYWA